MASFRIIMGQVTEMSQQKNSF